MDDDAVAELADLRRRAYGPDADILTDPAAVARLDELENRMRLRFAARSAPVEPGVAAGSPFEVDLPVEVADQLSADLAAPADAVAVVGEAPEQPARRGRRTALVAGVAAVAVLAVVQVTSGSTAPQPEESPLAASDVRLNAVPASDSAETTLVEIPLDRSLARYVQQTPQPDFPVEGGLSWAESLGPYYGWTLWLARTNDRDERCILLERDDKVYAQCLAEQGFLDGELDVSIPYGDVTADWRPARMTGGQSIVYRWTAERGVAIVLDEADITYFGDND